MFIVFECFLETGTVPNEKFEISYNLTKHFLPKNCQILFSLCKKIGLIVQVL